ncbi:MAG TPA: hypothetical protein VJ965_03455 [Anaerolineales bacterium]|nr:hypothetical protein [Anaerolineales bacterium]
MANINLTNVFKGSKISRGLVWGALILGALVAFEIFNYSTTDFAMSDLLGDLQFMGMRWSTILAIAFCGIDFAGIARLFTPEQGADEPNEVWYLFGAWLLAATMNASLTWWGVSIAILNHNTLGNAVIPREQLLKIVPIFVAVMVWVIRVLIIGTFSVAGERLFSQDDSPTARRSFQTKGANSSSRSTRKPKPRPSYSRPATSRRTASQKSFRPVAKPNRPEPTYHPLSMQSRSSDRSSDRSNGRSGDYRKQDYIG